MLTHNKFIMSTIFINICLVSIIYSQDNEKIYAPVKYWESSFVQLSDLPPDSCLAYDKSNNKCVLDVFEYNLFIKSHKPMKIAQKTSLDLTRKKVVSECLALKYYLNNTNPGELDISEYEGEIKGFIDYYKNIGGKIDHQKAELSLKEIKMSFLAKPKYYKALGAPSSEDIAEFIEQGLIDSNKIFSQYEKTNDEPLYENIKSALIKKAFNDIKASKEINKWVTDNLKLSSIFAFNRQSPSPESAEKSVEAPDELFYLSQNAPNPFKTSTTINYDAGKYKKGVIAIYDIHGKKINEYNIARKGTINWVAKGLTNGIYMCRFFAGNKVISKLIILSKWVVQNKLCKPQNYL